MANDFTCQEPSDDGPPRFDETPARLNAEPNSIPPLRNILDSFTLINPVNQFRRMVHQPHGGFAWNPARRRRLTYVTRRQWKQRCCIRILMKNCCHRRDGNGTSAEPRCSTTDQKSQVVSAFDSSRRTIYLIECQNGRLIPRFTFPAILLQSLRQIKASTSRQ